MAKIIGLPKLSPTMEEGTLVTWVEKEGEAVDIDDLLAEVETDKATMEFRSFDKGVLLKILVPEGETLVPDTPVAIIGAEGDDISALLEEAAAKSAAPAAAAAPTEEKPAAKPTAPSAPAPASGTATLVHDEGRVFASPLVRRLAREQDIDLRYVPGSGPKGRIVKEDFERFLASGASIPSGGASAGAAGFVRLPPRVEKASQMRKTIARRLTESKQEVPHFYLSIDMDAGPMIEARKQINAALAAREGGKVSFNDIVIKASALALREVPNANASWVDGAIHFHQVVDVSVAVVIPDGLVTPVIRDADRLGLADISAAVKDLATRAKDKKLAPEEMMNGTFSVSNLGMFGVESFSAVINPPEGMILAVGALRDAAVVKDGQLVAGKKMKVTLSCDHRVVDGALGAQWLQAFQRFIEAPMSMLL